MSGIQSYNVVELAANAVRTSTLTGSGVDLQSYDGYAQVILQSSAATAGTTPTLNVKLQDSADNSTDWTDITGAVFAEVDDTPDSTQMIQVNVSAVRRYVRVVGTIAGTDTPTFGFGVAMVARRASGRNASQAV